MRRLFAADKRTVAAASACAVIFLLCFFGLGSMPRYLAKQNLAQQGEMMARGMEDAVEAARQDLARLPAFAELNCRDGASPVLAEQEFDNDYVRWFAVAKNGRVACSSPMVNVDLPPREKLYALDGGWAAAVVPVSRGHQAFLLIQHRADADYVAILEPLLFDFESPAGCRECVRYEAVIGSDRKIVLAAGTPNRPTVISSKNYALNFKSHVELTFFATQEYVDEFRLPGKLLAAAIAAIVALTLSFMLYGLLVRRTSVANLVSQGVQRNEFLPYYQPIVDARDGSVLGAEALVRWRHRGELIPPEQFIAYTEQSSLIVAITEQVLEKVLVDLRQLGWVGTSRYISINATPDQIVQSDFCDMLIRRLAKNGIPAKNLAVEITERRQLTDLAEGRNRLLPLAKAGIDIKIDDAGTGFGGFSYVQELPVGTLKIDKMFVDTLLTQGDAKRPVLDAIIEFAQTSGLKIIAEGVETPEQVEYLVRAGVYAIQGFVYARPMSANELANWMKQETPTCRSGGSPTQNGTAGEDNTSAF